MNINVKWLNTLLKPKWLPNYAFATTLCTNLYTKSMKIIKSNTKENKQLNIEYGEYSYK